MKARILTVIGLISVVITFTARGQTNRWTDGMGKWENGSNYWSLGRAPSISDTADLITNAGNNTVTIDATTAGSYPATLTISNLTISANTLSLDNAGTNVPLQVLGQFLMTNGASLLISNSAMQVSGGPVVPIAGGNINLLSGSFAIGSNTLALGSVSNVSTLAVAGGTATMGGLNLGFSGNGKVLVTGGTLSVTNTTGTGQLSLYNGTFVLSNGATVVADTFVLTNATGNIFSSFGGTFIINTNATVDQGTMALSAGTTQFGAALTVASSASTTGSVSVTGGSLVATNGTTTVGGGSHSVGAITAANATLTLQETEVAPGSNAVATMSLFSNTVTTVLGDLIVGAGSGATGTVNLVGGTLTIARALALGNDGGSNGGSGTGFGLLTMSNASLTVPLLILGSFAGGHGIISADDTLTIRGGNGCCGNLNCDAVCYCTEPATCCTHIPCYAAVFYNGSLNATIDAASVPFWAGLTYPGEFIVVSNTVAFFLSGYVGFDNPGTMTMAGGTVNIYSNLTVGDCGASVIGTIAYSGGKLYVTNATHTAVLEVASGQFIMTGGSVVADQLVMTNSCGQFVRNSGTASFGSTNLAPNLSAVGDGIPNGYKQQYGLDPFNPTLANKDLDGAGFTVLQDYQAGVDPTNPAAAFHITSVTRQNGTNVQVIWVMGPNRTNALQATSGSANGSYNTNGFTDIFGVTNTVGTVTNYTDIRGATNVPSRYYRVRIVP